MEEFHENTHPDIFKSYFTLELFDKLVGIADYESWEGFNFSLAQFREWEAAFPEAVRTPEERAFCKHVAATTANFPEISYIIMLDKNSGRDVLNHELAHGYYFSSAPYHQEANRLVLQLAVEQPKAYQEVLSWLRAQGYNDEVMRDEVQAYLGTSFLHELQEIFPERTPEKIAQICAPFMELFLSPPNITVLYEHFTH